MFHSFLHRGCTGLVWPLIGLKCLRYSRGCTGFMFAFDLYTVVMLILIFYVEFYICLIQVYVCTCVYIYTHTYTHVIIVTVLENLDIFYTGLACAENIDDMKSRPWPRTQPYCRVRSFCPLLRVCKPCHLPRPPPKSPFIESSWSLIVGMWGILVGSWGVWAFSSINFGGDEKSPTRCSSGLRVEGNLRTRINHGATPLGRIISGELCP